MQTAEWPKPEEWIRLLITTFIVRTILIRIRQHGWLLRMVRTRNRIRIPPEIETVTRVPILIPAVILDLIPAGGAILVAGVIRAVGLLPTKQEKLPGCSYEEALRKA